jgi:hypothetical protein
MKAFHDHIRKTAESLDTTQDLFEFFLKVDGKIEDTGFGYVYGKNKGEVQKKVNDFLKDKHPLVMGLDISLKKIGKVL